MRERVKTLVPERRRIIDLSPRAADALEMKRAGVVAVVVEPLVH